MPSWWPFSGSSSSGDDDAVRPIRGAAESDAFRRRTEKTGEDTDYASKRQTDKMLDWKRVTSAKDARALAMDVNSIDSLVNRYQAEFDEADRIVKKKEEDTSYFDLYDYDTDQRYQQWRQDQEDVKKRLGIHWFDSLVDHPYRCFLYFLRGTTVAGLFYGLGRTAYLYRTMDKVYAKLNGVTLSGIAFGEVTSAVAKGTGVAAASTFGLVVGEASTNVVRVAFAPDASVPERHWTNVAASCTCGGFFAGAALGGMHYKTLTLWGMGMITAACTAMGSCIGFYVGYCVYRPFAAKREHTLNDPYWRPWHTRSRIEGGPPIVRGKYI